MGSLKGKFESLIMFSSTSQTWAKNCSAWNSYRTFCSAFDCKFDLPIDIKMARAYVTWALTKKNLKPGTVNAYLCSLKLAHELSDTICADFSKDRSIALLLRGGKNKQILSSKSPPARCPFNIYLLRILGHRLALEDWNDISRAVVWAACTTGFFSSCRMGEILATQDNMQNNKLGLKWKHVQFRPKNEIVIYTPYTKTTGLKGAFLYIFPLEKDPCCPVRALNNLKRLCTTNNLYNSEAPVFRFSSGRLLTLNKLNEILEQQLPDFFDEKIKISCHSFRAALATSIASHQNNDCETFIKEWGGWKSDCYRLYTKGELDAKRSLFNKIVKLL